MHRMDEQPQKLPGAQSRGGYLCVLCALCGFFYRSSGVCILDDESVSIRVIRGICVLSFFDGSVILCVVVVWGLQRRQIYIILKLIKSVSLCGSFSLSLGGCYNFLLAPRNL